MSRIHGGADALGIPRFDFSSNSNACGPCPAALTLIQQADASRYPDPSYASLREALAAFHGVATWRIVLAGSASEFIFRMTAWVAKQSLLQAKVCVPKHGYGDYSDAAGAWGLGITSNPLQAHLIWAAEPSSPLGKPQSTWLEDHIPAQQTVVLDYAYEPLRLSGQPTLDKAQRDQVWQLWTPNKALGLTGVRAAYAIAPDDAQMDVQTLEQLSASWPIGSHGAALLAAWTSREAQSWLATSLQTLKEWKARQIELLTNLGWVCSPSDANFFCASFASDDLYGRKSFGETLVCLREQGIKLRDATSFGMPEHARVSVQTRTAQDALITVLKEMQ